MAGRAIFQFCDFFDVVIPVYLTELVIITKGTERVHLCPLRPRLSDFFNRFPGLAFTRVLDRHPGILQISIAPPWSRFLSSVFHPFFCF